MNTNLLKKFACEARNILKKGIRAKLQALGFNDKGQVPDHLLPQLVQGGTIWNGTSRPEGFYHQWMAIHHQVARKGVQVVVEEAAYTWFNRLVAIRILQKNGLCEPVLIYTNEARTPRIVDEARMGRMPQMPESTRRHLMELLEDDTKITEQFALLITAWCHQNPVLQACFGGMEDFTELLLPINILAEGGFVDLLNHTEFITEEDFKSPELIGWLYQFYISERKDEVFAKKGKFEADEIPAATQIFTPNWIVKYMVQNTVGRIYLDNNPGTTAFKEKWQYLVEPAEPTHSDSIYRYDELTDLKVGDLACGSGHILNECFDLLYDLYIYEGYSRSEAVENIFIHNLTGIDLDKRAQQLTVFALLLKACQKDTNFADAHCLPQVLTMPKAMEEQETVTGKEIPSLEAHLHHFCQEEGSSLCYKELSDAFILMQDADSLGSIMKFDISPTTRLLIQQMVEHWGEQRYLEDAIVEELMPGMKLILALTQEYSALVMNPPYMGGGNMNEILSKYVKKNYEIGKADLATVLVERMAELTSNKGKYAFIIPPSWMFLSTFENLRRDIIDNRSIDSLLHLSRGVFGADFGSSSAVITNVKSSDAKGFYFRLIERTFQEFDQKHLQLLFEKTLANPVFRYYFADYTKDVEDIVYSEQGAKIFYPSILQSNFEKIPGCPIGYWVSEKILTRFAGNLALSAVCKPTQGLATADNARFLRYWSEVNLKKIGFGMESSKEALESKLKWFPHNKGGSFRRWYGNQEFVVNWENDGCEIINFRAPNGKQLSRPQNINYYFGESISWSKIVSNTISFRFFPNGFIFDCAALSIFIDNNTIDNKYLLGILNSYISKHILGLLSPTMNCEVGQISGIPIVFNEEKDKVTLFVSQNTFISKQDWDAHETSWDFKTSPLLAMRDETMEESQSLEDMYKAYHNHWEEQFYQLHANEEELNRQFIEIYGLQDELTPDVPLSEVTILQQGEISIESVDVKDENSHE